MNHCLGLTPGTCDGVLSVSSSIHASECRTQSVGVLNSDGDSYEIPKCEYCDDVDKSGPPGLSSSDTAEDGGQSLCPIFSARRVASAHRSDRDSGSFAGRYRDCSIFCTQSNGLSKGHERLLPDTQCELGLCLRPTPRICDGVLLVSGSSHVPECSMQSVGVLDSCDTLHEFPDVQRDPDRRGSEDLCDTANLDYSWTTPDQPSQIVVDDRHLSEIVVRGGMCSVGM